MIRSKRMKNSGKSHAMPASKKRNFFNNGKASSVKAKATASKKVQKSQLEDLGDEIDGLLNEVSQKIDKRPVSKQNGTARGRNKKKNAPASRNVARSKSTSRHTKTIKATPTSARDDIKMKAGNARKNKSKSAKQVKGKPNRIDTDFSDVDDEDEREESEEESNDESDWDESEGTKPKSKSKSSKGKANNCKKRKTQKPSVPKRTLTDDEEDDFEEESSLDEESDEESEMLSDDENYSPHQGLKGGKSKKLKQNMQKKKIKGKGKVTNTFVATKKEKIPPVSEMVIESIKALGANPKKGSNLRSIKSTILLNWPINIKMYNSKIKKFVVSAIEKGDILRVKGNGFNGRFTVPGLKMKKKKKSMKLGKKFDEDEEEYAPKRTKRDDDREENKVVVEKERENRKTLEDKQLRERESRPKKRVVKKEQWEVEAIKGIKDKNDERYYLVKWKGYSKLNWEPEENVQDCDVLIDDYIDATKRKEEDLAKWKRLADKGTFEPVRILDVKIAKGKRKFLVRWKGHGPESDKWELESNLNCRMMIEKFMFYHEKDLQRTNSTREMREAPKRLERFVFATSKRVAKRTGGLAMSYAGMDED